MTTSARECLAVLRRDHDRFFELVVGLTPDELSQRSYCNEWSVADVLSHLGSGAEIFTQWALAGLHEREPVAHDEMEEIWARWNALTPVEKAEKAALSSDDFLDRLEALDDETLESLVFTLPGGHTMPAPTMLSMRLVETALHGWDVEVTFELSARVRPEAVDLIVDTLATSAPRWAASEGWGGPKRIQIDTSEPERHFLASLEDGLSWDASAAGEAPAAARLAAEAEAVVRLVYGRLDEAHTPSGIEVSGIDLDELRKLFPGR